MRISDWSSDVCSSDLVEERPDRVAALTDSALVDNCVAIDLDREGLRLGGIASLPTFNRGVADHQYLFVNGRPVKDRLLAGARSEERRGGKECVSTGRSRWSRYN